MHFLLLNPPGRLSYSRDYFCSKVTKAGYAEHPLDLLILSGIISASGHKVSLLDAIAERLDFIVAKRRIDSLDIDVIIFLSGTTSWSDDFAFLQEIKYSRPNLSLIGLGDIFLDQKTFINNPWIDAVILDFTKDEFLRYIDRQDENFQTLSFRRGDRVYIASGAISADEFRIPLPRHELFLGIDYSFPFVRRLPFATMLTDYGCSFSCSFCLYPSLGFKLRNLDNVLAELRYIYSLGIKELFIKDQSFGARKERTIALCEGMRKVGDFSWTCFLRTDIADLELLKAIKKAGCHTVIFGVETANEEILKKYKTGVNKENIKEAFRACRQLGINTVGIFILGFPEEDQKSCQETINFALDLKCDFASFNLFVPKMNSSLRKDLIKQRLLSSNDFSIQDQSGIAAVRDTDRLSQQELVGLRHLALRRFYLRPLYVFKLLITRAFSKVQLKMLLNSGLFIIKDLSHSAGTSPVCRRKKQIR